MIALGALLAVLALDDDVTLVFGGDVAFGRVVAGEVRPIGGADALAGVAPWLAGADLAVVNLEGALFDGASPADGIRLIAPTAAAQALAAAGVDLVSIANNHALDAGVEGLASTLSTLARIGIDPVGANTPHDDVIVRSVDGLRVAFIAASDRLNPTTPLADLVHIRFFPSARLGAVLSAEVRSLATRGVADVIVVLLHWGLELAPGPTHRQRTLARALVDAGATLVIGHHPHVVHEVERHGRGVIFYSLGNLLFDMRDARTRTGALGRVTLDRAGRVARIELLPTIAGPGHAPAVTLTADR